MPYLKAYPDTSCHFLWLFDNNLLIKPTERIVTIKIGTSERRDRDINTRWIQDQINSRRQGGERICVRFHVQCSDVNIRLASGDCPKSVGGSRKLKVKEELIVDEWRKKSLSNEVNAGKVVSFYEFVKRLCD